MTTETHTLHLAIDASAGQKASRDFTAALNAVKKAVQDLDREADGTFSKLTNRKPQFDVTPLTRATTEAQRLSTAMAGAGSASERAAQSIQRTALSSASAIRMAEQASQRLAIRMADIGDTAGLANLTAALARMKGQLVDATSPLDVRKAKSGFDDVRSSLLQATVATEHMRGEQAQLARQMAETNREAAQSATQLEALALKYNPLRQQSLAYAQSLEEISRAEQAGVITAQLAEQARTRSAQSLLATSAASDRFTKSSHANGAAIANVSAQFQDVAVMMAAGQNPFQLALQQGTQLSAVLNTMGGRATILRTLASGFMSMINPVSLLTIGVILAGSAIVQWMTSGSEATMSFSDALSQANTAISNMNSATDTLTNARLGSLSESYGLVNEQLRIHLERLAQISQLEAVNANRDMAASVESSMTGGWLTTDLDDVRISLDTTVDSARHFLGLLDQIKQARTFAEQATAISTARKYLESIGITLDNAEGSAQAVLIQLVKSEDAALKLKNASEESASAIAGAVGQTGAWASAMAGVRSEINAILSSLSAIGGGVISNAAKRVEVTALQAGQTVRQAEVARLRFENERKLAAKEMGATGVSGWFQRQLVGMERFQFDEGIRLDDQLNAERERARKRETASTGGGKGGGGGRAAELSDEQKAVEKLNKTLTDRMTSLEEERVLLGLVASGQFETAEGAKLMAEAMVQGGGAVDAQTTAMIRQIDVAAKLNEELTKAAKDPVKEWMDSVPNWLEAGKQIEMGAIDSLKGAISEFIKTGTFDINSLGEAILGTIADIVADKAVKELMALLGRDSQSATGGFGGMLAGLFSSKGDTPIPGVGGDGAAVAAGGQQAGTAISTAMLQAGQQVSAQIQAAMTGAGAQAGAAVRAGGQQGLALGANNIRLAASTGGAQLGQGVVQGAQAGAPILAQGVAAGAGGGGGGFLSGLGGWQGILGMALGAFSEGGYATSPVGTATASLAAFANAPHYAQGTANTSGIPSILHPNEAVIPLSRGRKIPVELGDSAGGGQTINAPQYITITTPDADSFRRSEKQIALQMARSGRIAEKHNG